MSKSDSLILIIMFFALIITSGMVSREFGKKSMCLSFGGIYSMDYGHCLISSGDIRRAMTDGK